MIKYAKGVIDVSEKRGLKNRTTISSTLKNENYQKIKEISNETMIPISKLLDQAVESLISNYKKH